MLQTFLLCNDSCGVNGDLPSGLNECDLDGMQTTGEMFAIIKCDYQFTDITDPVEWDTAITAGNIVLTPRGFWGKDAASVTNFDLTCGRKKQVQEGQQLVFTSNLVQPLTAEEQDFYKDVRNRVSKYRFLPISCCEDGTRDYWVTDGYVENITVSGESPGHIGTWVNPPDNVVTSGLNNLLQWGFTIQFPVTGIMCRRKLPLIDGVVAP